MNYYGEIICLSLTLHEKSSDFQIFCGKPSKLLFL